MATRRIEEYLDGNHVRYAHIRHSKAYSASQVAQSVHIPGRSMAKVVIVMINNRLAMAVVPATREVDMALLQCATGVLNVRLAAEADFLDRFDGCQLGAIPPFGSLFGVEAYVEPRLVQDSHIAFSAGTHHDVFVMNTDDYLKLARPTLAHIDASPVAEQFQALHI